MSQVQIVPDRLVPLGGPRAMRVRRTLPHRDRRMVGAWCFADDFGPQVGTMSVPPHPHIGLQTVSWLCAGTVRHRDSLGNEQVIVPGQLNLMTAGRGIAHSEHSTGDGPLHGLQLWVALPAGLQDMDPAFEHIPELPLAGEGSWEATVLVGEFAGTVSPATIHSPLVAAEVVLAPGSVAEIPLTPEFEYGMIVSRGDVQIENDQLVEVVPGPLAYQGPGAPALRLHSRHGACLMLLGGAPYRDPLAMWWNFVASTAEAIEQARADWEAGRRFAAVPGGEARLPAPELPATPLRVREPGR